MAGDILSIVRSYEQSESPTINPESRPCFHVSPLLGWMNDPNGFSFYKGEYHLFYQYYPYETIWGPMHWGHVKSKDLIRWEYLPCALAPDRDYDREGCWSGSALEMPDGRHAIIYTGRMPVNRNEGEEHILQVQCLAYGDGVNYEKFEGNPILTEKDLPEGSSRYDFRDPKIWWDQRENAYMMLAGNMASDGAGQLLLYRSSDTVHWEFLNILDASHNEYGKMWECPEFFEIGDTAFILTSPQETVYGGEFQNRHGNMVISGTYDPVNHTFERNEVHAIDFGYDFYATQTLQTDDGRRIMIAWMQGWENASMVRGIACPGWTGMMTLPRELSVRDGKLIQTPVRELEAYRHDCVTVKDFSLCGEAVFPGIEGRCIDMSVDLIFPEGTPCSRFELALARSDEYRNVFACDPISGLITFDRTLSGYINDALPVRRLQLPPEMKKLSLRVILDRYSAEIFVNDGEQVLTSVIETPQEANGISFCADAPVILNIEKYNILIP